MAVDERARHQLHQALERELGAEEADTLMSQLPPSGHGDLATKADVGLVRSEVEVLGAQLRMEMATQRADLMATINEQTKTLFRTIVFTNVGSMVMVAGLAFGAAQLT